MQPSTDDLLTQAMTTLACQSDKVIFVGQGVEYGGVATYKHLRDVPAQQRLEFPVAEELQLGVCIGLSLQGYLPVCIFPRIDFMMRCMDQLVNHLDKLEQMTVGRFKPKVIIRTRVGSKKTIDAGPQHTQNHVEALNSMLTWIDMFEITRVEQILSKYQFAFKSTRLAIVVENLG